MSGGAGAPVSGDATREGRRAADAMAGGLTDIVAEATA